MTLRFLTAGESHGPALIGLVDGLPAGLRLSEDKIAEDLARRQRTYGRSERQRIEEDRARILGGLVRGRTTGAPVALLIENLDHANWIGVVPPSSRIPRPGHADLAGCLKWGVTDTRLVSERASARETAARVALGAVAKALLAEAGARVLGETASIGRLEAPRPSRSAAAVDRSSVRCGDVRASAAMVRAIDRARSAGETLGGSVRVTAFGVPPGLGSPAQWDRRIDGRIGQALLSIPLVKGVEIGDASWQSRSVGSRAQDPIRPGFKRPTNHAGGIEGGMTNGQPVVARLWMKPIPTLKRGLPSVDLRTGRSACAPCPRSDVCAVPAATVIAEAMLAWVLADALLERFGADRVSDLRRSLR